jgi:hypothetical protein
MHFSPIDEKMIIKYVRHVVNKDVEVAIEYNNIIYRKGSGHWFTFSATPNATLKAAYSWNAKRITSSIMELTHTNL